MKAVETAVINNTILTVLVEAQADSKAYATYFVNGEETDLYDIGVRRFTILMENMYDEICRKHDLIKWTV